jgi:SAM-dependent methyltransferase
MDPSTSSLPAFSGRAPAPARPRDYVAIALLSATVLMYEVAVTRVLSVVLWYHFAFLAISLAMLGLSLPGVWFTLRKPRADSLAWWLLASGLTVPLSIAVLFTAGRHLPLGQTLPGLGMFLQPGMLVVIACVLAPLLCLGSAVCLLLIRAEGRLIARMYAADLLGATCGAVVIVPLMHVVPTPLIVAGAGLLPLVAAWIVRARRAAALTLGVILAGAVLYEKPFHLSFAKNYAERKDLLYTKWTPTARLSIYPDVFYVKDPGAAFGWGMGYRYQPVPIRQLWLEQDGSAGTPITQLTGQPRDLDHLFFDVTSVGYQLRPPARAAVIGGGGGRDVLTALKAGAQHVDAVELNRHIVEALSGPFASFSGDVYHLPGVNAVVAEGRNFLTHSDGNYDLIQISLIDSWAATAAGAFALSEAYLYTVDALRLYLRKLAPGGVVSISRWMSGERELEAGRLALMIRRALELEGIGDPLRHLCVLQSWDVGTFLVSRAAFEPGELAKLDTIDEERGFFRRWPVPEGGQSSIVAYVLEHGPEGYEEEGADLSPATDDRPFFFQTLSLLHKVDSDYLARLSNNEHSVSMLKTLVVTVSALTVLLFFSPFAFTARRRRSADFWRASSYFLCVGLGFMLVEMPLVQRFVLYLGHPSYATTVVLATLLLGAGLGSFCSSAVPARVLARYALVLPLSLACFDPLLGRMFEATLGSPFGVRCALAALLLVPTGFMLGFPFSAGMQVFGDQDKPWCWAVNGAASVLSTVFSLALSIVLGLRATMLLGAGIYAVAVLLFARTARAQHRGTTLETQSSPDALDPAA